MKKSLVALAVLAASGAAMAQSSVTLFGIVDAAYGVGKGSISNKTQLKNSGYNSSRLGFRGVEDLGGGLKAGFHIEAGMNNDDGTGSASSAANQAQTAANVGTQGLTFNRRSVVTLSGSMGELILGRDYTPQFWSETVYDFRYKRCWYQHLRIQRRHNWCSFFQRYRLEVTNSWRRCIVGSVLHGRKRIYSS